MKFFHQKEREMDEDLKELEVYLQQVLQPVAPRAEFTRRLNARIMSREIPPSSKILPPNITNGLLVAGGVLGSLIMLVTSIRGLISLISFVGLFFQYLNKNNQRRQVTPV